MQKITWHAFAINGSLTKTVLHFFGHSKEVSAPYPLHASIRILCGSNYDAFPLTLEGARLQTPEGVRLDSIIEHCNLGDASLFGLELTLQSQHTRVSLEHSQCILELDGKGYTTFFKGTLSDSCVNQDFATKTIPIIFDTNTVTSFMFVNPDDQEHEIPFEIVTQGKKEFISQDKIPARTALEIQVPEHLVSQGILAGIPLSSRVAGFAVYRDAAVRRAMSVVNF